MQADHASLAATTASSFRAGETILRTYDLTKHYGSRVVVISTGKIITDRTVEELTRGQGEYVVRLERVQEELLLLQQQPWSKNARLDEADTLITSAPQENGRDLYTFLAQAGFTPESLAPATQNLEQVFFSLINAHERDKEQ